MSGTHDHNPPHTAAEDGAQDDFVDENAEQRQERRLHLLAFDYWHGLKEGRTYPLFKALTPAGLAPFRDNCLLLELTDDDALVRYVGPHVAELLDGDVEKGASLSSFAGSQFAEALFGQYATDEGRTQAVEFEFEEEALRCRGVILPFSNTGDHPHFSMVVANSRVYAAEDLAEAETRAEEAPLPTGIAADDIAADAAEEAAEESAEETGDAVVAPDAVVDDQEPAGEATTGGADTDRTEESDPQESDPQESDAQQSHAAPPIGGDLEAVVAASRSAAGGVAHLDGGSREKLYQALAAALALYEEAAANPAAFAALLKEAGLKMQARAPFTPALKLTFGKNYDKTRLTEYAAALAYASRQGQSADTLAAFLEAEPGGIKGCVRRERAARRGESGTSAAKLQDKAVTVARGLPAVGADALESDEEFCLVIARRAEDGGGYELIGPADVGRNTVDAAIRRLADKSKNKP